MPYRGGNHSRLCCCWADREQLACQSVQLTHLTHPIALRCLATAVSRDEEDSVDRLIHGGGASRAAAMIARLYWSRPVA